MTLIMGLGFFFTALTLLPEKQVHLCILKLLANLRQSCKISKTHVTRQVTDPLSELAGYRPRVYVFSKPGTQFFKP